MHVLEKLGLCRRWVSNNTYIDITSKPNALCGCLMYTAQQHEQYASLDFRVSKRTWTNRIDHL
eukprot:scaffold21247_cov45-Attheya_sp.AAC.3